MSEILSVEEWRYHMLGAKGDDRTHDWLVLERDREALRARVRDLEAALHRYGMHKSVNGRPCPAAWGPAWGPPDRRCTCGLDDVLAALGAVPQPARCPTCNSDDPNAHPTYTGWPRPDPWHREAHSG